MDHATITCGRLLSCIVPYAHVAIHGYKKNGKGRLDCIAPETGEKMRTEFGEKIKGKTLKRIMNAPVKLFFPNLVDSGNFYNDSVIPTLNIVLCKPDEEAEVIPDEKVPLLSLEDINNLSGWHCELVSEGVGCVSVEDYDPAESNLPAERIWTTGKISATAKVVKPDKPGQRKVRAMLSVNVDDGSLVRAVEMAKKKK